MNLLKFQFSFYYLVYFLIFPLLEISYLYETNCSKPTGPLGGSVFVDMPTSPPKPNSPPSANCVEVLCIAIELLTFFKNLLAVFLFLVIMESVCIVPYLLI